MIYPNSPIKYNSDEFRKRFANAYLYRPCDVAYRREMQIKICI